MQAEACACVCDLKQSGRHRLQLEVRLKDFTVHTDGQGRGAQAD